MSLKLSIIIVSYNTRDLTLDCIESVFNQTAPGSFELLVMDNASTDGSAAAIRSAFPAAYNPELRLFALPENLGFAGANNLAAAEARSEYVLLLNPDTVVLDRALDTLVAFAEHRREWGVYGGSTMFADGRRNPTAGWMKPSLWSMFCVAVGLAKLFPRSGVLNPESLEGWSWDAPREVDIVTGCLLMMRTADWRRLGGFDERYFMYGEDADLCLRAAAAGLRSVLVPAAEIVHYGGASEPVRSDRLVRLFNAKAQLFRAHYSRPTAAAMVAMLRLWCAVRIAAFGLAGAVAPVAKQRRAEWSSVWQRRRHWTGGTAAA